MILSIIIPVYNEKRTILEVLDKINSVKLDRIKKDIMLVDDFSTDGTREILSNLDKRKYRVFYHSKNMGKGHAIRTGLRRAKGDVVVIQDADLEYDPADYNKLIKPITDGKFSVVYGSRFLGRSNKELKSMPLHYLGNRLVTFLTNLLFNANLTDMETCYKMFKKNVLEGIALKARGFELEPEITSKLLKRGYRIKEVKISYNYRTYSQGKKIRKMDGLKAMYYLLKYRFVD